MVWSASAPQGYESDKVRYEVLPYLARGGLDIGCGPAKVWPHLIGIDDRSDRIRTYNFPQGRLTDHRINLTLYKLQYVMDGDLAEVLQALAHAREAEQLEELEMGASIQGGQ